MHVYYDRLCIHIIYNIHIYIYYFIYINIYNMHKMHVQNLSLGISSNKKTSLLSKHMKKDASEDTRSIWEVFSSTVLSSPFDSNNCQQKNGSSISIVSMKLLSRCIRRFFKHFWLVEVLQVHSFLHRLDLVN